MSPRIASVGHLIRNIAWHLSGKGRKRRWAERDPRHAMRAPVLYRPRGGLFWYNGILEDFSLTGVRFRGDRYLPLKCPLEMSFEVPLNTGDNVKGNFFCWAEIVRSVLPSLGDAQFGICARILRYRSQLSTAADFRKVIGEVRGPLETQTEKVHPRKPSN